MAEKYSRQDSYRKITSYTREHQLHLTDGEKEVISDIIAGTENLDDQSVFEIELKDYNDGSITQADIDTAVHLLRFVSHIITDGPLKGKRAREERRKKERSKKTQLVNNPPGYRKIFEAETGFEHHRKRYSRIGRNHTGRARARRTP